MDSMRSISYYIKEQKRFPWAAVILGTLIIGAIAVIVFLTPLRNEIF